MQLQIGNGLRAIGQDADAGIAAIFPPQHFDHLRDVGAGQEESVTDLLVKTAPTGRMSRFVAAVPSDKGPTRLGCLRTRAWQVSTAMHG